MKFKRGDLINYAGDYFRILENYGRSGKVQEYPNGGIISKFYWNFNGIESFKVGEKPVSYEDDKKDSWRIEVAISVVSSLVAICLMITLAWGVGSLRSQVSNLRKKAETQRPRIETLSDTIRNQTEKLVVLEGRIRKLEQED